MENLQHIERTKEPETNMKRVTKAHEAEVAKLKEELEDMHANFEVEKANKGIFSDEKVHLQRILDELLSSKEECFSFATQC